jgi:PEGA domain
MTSILRTLVLIPFFLLISCGTIFKSGPESVPVYSEPAGAEVWLDGKLRGNTPTTLSVPHTSKGQLMVKLDGYQQYDHKIGTNFNATTLVNILWGWLMPVGFLIDAASGSLSTWDESGIHVKLVPRT